MNQEAFGDVCPPSVIKWLNSPFRKLFQNLNRYFRSSVSEGDIVADIGCGGGFYTVDLAKRVGEQGKVYAVDLQQEMLNITKKYATRKGVASRIKLHLCESTDLKIPESTFQFVLAMYVVHEVPDRAALFSQVYRSLKSSGKLLLIEPSHHVSGEKYKAIVRESHDTGFLFEKKIRLCMSKGVLLAKE